MYHGGGSPWEADLTHDIIVCFCLSLTGADMKLERLEIVCGAHNKIMV